MDCSLPGSSIHEILQARVLEWGAIAFPDIANWLHSKYENIKKKKKEEEEEEPRYSLCSHVAHSLVGEEKCL